MNITPPSGSRHYGIGKYGADSYDHWSNKNYWIPKPDDPLEEIWIPTPGISEGWIPIPNESPGGVWTSIPNISETWVPIQEPPRLW